MPQQSKRADGAACEDLALVDEVKLTVWHMRNLPKTVRTRFTSDMGFVADFLNEGSFEGHSRQKILHGEALCEMMEALTNDTRFTGLIGKLRKKQEKGEEIFMCEYIDMREARGKIAGENKLASLPAKLYSLGRELCIDS